MNVRGGSENGSSFQGQVVYDKLFRAVNARNENLASPLHLAAQVGSLECVMVLISHGAELNARDARGATALHYSAQSLVGSSADVVELLLSLRANPWLRSGNIRDYNSTGFSKDKGYLALEVLPSIIKCAEQGIKIFMEREKVMDLLRAHMGLPETDAEPPMEIVPGK